MSFHENFWIAVAAAAPVVALAAIVSVADTFRASDRIYRIYRTYAPDPTTIFGTLDWPTINRRRRFGNRLLRGGYTVGLINGGLQFAAVWMALQSLADGNDVVATLFPAIAVPLGIFLLLVSTGINAVLRIVQQSLEELYHLDGWSDKRGGPPPGESQVKHD